MDPITDLGGWGLGWGTFDGAEHLLLRTAATGYETVEGDGQHHPIDTTALGGRVAAGWSPRADAVWLRSGIQTPVLRLDAWSPNETRQLASVRNDIGATNIIASQNTEWLAMWFSGCATSSPGGSRCALTIAVTQPGVGFLVPLVVDLEGVLGSVWVADDGTVLFTVADANGRLDLWRAPVDGSPEVWFGGSTTSPLADAQLAVTSAETAAVVDLRTASETELDFPPDVSPAEVLSVSPDGVWIALQSREDSVTFRRRTSGSPQVDLPISPPTRVSVFWPGDDHFAAVLFGPPPTTTVVRIAP